jgi:LysR family transcriptional regulator, carnitine catabolism transcriptional activator
LIYPTLRQLEAFLQVARRGSFTAASSAIGLSQPALSHTIGQLEDLIGAKLFNRTTRAVNLTHVGQHFLPIAERVLLDLDAGLHDLREMTESKRGVVIVGCLSSVGQYLLPRVIGTFSTRYPKVKVLVRDDNSPGVVRRLKNGEVDFAVSSMPEPDRDFAIAPILRDPLQLVCRPDHPFASRRCMHWRELGSGDFIAMEQGTNMRRLLGQALPELSGWLKPRYEASSMVTLLGMIEAGLGAAVLPALSTPRNSGFVTVPLVEPSLAREICFVMRIDRSLPPAAERFRETILETLADGKLVGFPEVEVIYGRGTAATQQ